MEEDTYPFGFLIPSDCSRTLMIVSFEWVFDTRNLSVKWPDEPCVFQCQTGVVDMQVLPDFGRERSCTLNTDLRSQCTSRRQFIQGHLPQSVVYRLLTKASSPNIPNKLLKSGWLHKKPPQYTERPQ